MRRERKRENTKEKKGGEENIILITDAFYAWQDYDAAAAGTSGR